MKPWYWEGAETMRTLDSASNHHPQLENWEMDQLSLEDLDFMLEAAWAAQQGLA